MPEVSRTCVEIEGERGQGFTVTADHSGLEMLGAEFLRLARECDDGQSASVEIGDDTFHVVRQDVPPVVAPLTWKDRLASFGALILVALFVVSLLRSCVALHRDVANWLGGASVGPPTLRCSRLRPVTVLLLLHVLRVGRSGSAWDVSRLSGGNTWPDPTTS